MRPDWENVIPGMFDALAAEPEVDPQRIVLVGRSFGGLTRPAAAAGEHRLAALIVDPGQFDMGPALSPRSGRWLTTCTIPPPTSSSKRCSISRR